MGSEVGTVREDLGLTENDIAAIRVERRRQRLVLVLAGGLGMIAGLVAGVLAVIVVNNDTNESYPYMLPLAAVGMVGKTPRVSRVGIAIAAVVGFLVMFIPSLGLVAAPMYGVSAQT